MISKFIVSKFGSWTLKEYNSLSALSVLSVHIPITKFQSSRDLSSGIFIFFSLALSQICDFSKTKILSIPLDINLKSAFSAFGIVLSIFIYNPANSDWKSKYISEVSWGSHTS